MPVEKRAIAPPQFSELLNLFPCPAWIENFSGQILARNTHLRAIKNRRPLKTVVYPLPPRGNAKKMRLVALFPAAQKTDCQDRVISVLLAKILQASQAAATGGDCLTPCQREIYRELAHGHSYKTIAAHLGISHEAVRQRIVQMRRKLGASQIPLLRRRT